MRITVDRRGSSRSQADVLVSALVERSGENERLPRSLVPVDALTGGLVTASWNDRELRGRPKEFTVIRRPDGQGRVALVGLGPARRVSAETVRRAAAVSMRALRGKGVRSVGFRLSTFVVGGVRSADAAGALSEGASLGAYEFTKYRPSRDPPAEEAIIVVDPEVRGDPAPIRRAVEHGRTVAEIVRWTRDIANLPADTATPQRLAEEAEGLGKELGLSVSVFDERQLAEMHCGGLLAVGGGSSHPPRLVAVEYPGRRGTKRTVAVVGKGITFDSGGISIKPSLHLSEMKFDKSGAVAVLGILRAASILRVAPRVVGILACAENLPGGSAYRPGDVVTTYGGKTIEVLNTDAEGRVVLSDALAFAVDRYSPDTVIDLATLTGACVTALGDDTAGLVSTDDRLASALLAASARAGEPLWRLPLTDYHRELVQSDIADVRNSTEIAPAGALTAAAFLETFVGGSVAWAHLDIAGPAWTNGATRKYQPAYQPPGATGFGVRLVTRYLEGIPR